MSLFSFGEKLEIIVGTENLETVVYVKSNAIVPWNLSADTKGKVERIFEELEKFTK